MIECVKSFVALLLLTTAKQAVSNDLSFHHLGLSEGLPSVWVWDFAQDRQGLMWIGTDAGLARFDGYQTLVFFHQENQPNTLLSNKIRALHVDDLDRLWVGSEDGGLNRFDAVAQQFAQIDFGNYAVNSVYALAAYNGQLLIGADTGLYSLQPDQNIATSIPLGRELKITAVVADQSDNIWIGTTKGLFRYQPESGGELVQVALDGVSDRRVLALALDSVNTLWIAADKILYARSSGELTPQHRLSGRLPDSYIPALRSLSDGQLAIGTFAGLYLYDPETDALVSFYPNKNVPSSLTDAQIFSLYQDFSGSLWVGTFAGGLSYANPAMQQLGLMRDTPQCPVGDAEYAQSSRSGDIWIARGAAITKINAAGDCTTYTITDASGATHRIAGLYFDADDQLWAWLEQGGAARLIDDVFVPYEHPLLAGVTIRSMHHSSSERLWVGTEKHGLMSIDKSTADVQRTGVYANLAIYEIVPWRDGLLMATKEGGLFFDPLKKAFSRPLKATGHLELYTLVVDERRQVIWAGTRSNGLYRSEIDSGETVPVTAAEGFSGKKVPFSLIDRHGVVWIGSESGLFRLSPGETQFKKLRGSDGLHDDAQEGGHYAAGSDTIVVVGKGGINRFKASVEMANPVPPRIAITNFAPPGSTDHTPVLPGAKLKLDYRNRDFSVEFTGSHYDDPLRNRYAYRLQNYDDRWIHTNASHRTATYTSLAPGQYQLQIKAANKDGLWTKETANFDLAIAPAQWATWWAKLLYLALAALALFSVVSWRNRQIHRKAAQLQELVTARTREIAEQKDTIEFLLDRKNDLFAAISHEFRTPLTLIDGPLQLLTASYPDAQQDTNIRLIRDNSQRLLKLVDQLLALAKLDRKEPVRMSNVLIWPVVSALVASFRPSANARSISIELLSGSSDDAVISAPDTVEIVLSNLLSNAIKYCPPGSGIRVAVESDERQISIVVKDDGPGIAEAEQALVFQRFYRCNATAARAPGTGLGLAVACELAQGSGGTLRLESEPGAGATFRFTLNRGSAHAHSHTESDLLPIIERNSIDTGSDEAFKSAPTTERTSAELPGQETAQILIIDDDAGMRTYIAQCLQQFECRTAASGDEGLAIAVQLIPDLIVCDVMMPGKDGFEVAHAIRADERISHVPIILLTARVDQESRHKGWEENIDEYLHKPFDPSELVARINNLLAVRRILQRRFGSEVSMNRSAGQPAHSKLPQREALFIAKLDQSIHDNYSNCDYKPEQMAAACAMSLRQLQRKLKAVIDCTPADYLREYRLLVAAKQLADDAPVGLVGEDCGFSSASQFSRCFKAHYGTAPKQYQQQCGQQLSGI